MVHKQKVAMLTSGDLAFLIKEKQLHTPIGKIVFIGRGKKEVENAYRYLYGRKSIHVQ